MATRNSEVLASFVAYCKAHPKCDDCGSFLLPQLPPNGGKPWVCPNYNCASKYKKNCSVCKVSTNDFGYGDGLCSSCRTLKKYGKPSQPVKQVKFVVEIKNPRQPYDQQWHVPGSGQKPYVVSRAGTGWSCDCMSWTRNMPREDCKHILRVKLEQLVSGPASQEKKSTAPPKPEGGRRFR